MNFNATNYLCRSLNESSYKICNRLLSNGELKCISQIFKDFTIGFASFVNSKLNVTYFDVKCPNDDIKMLYTFLDERRRINIIFELYDGIDDTRFHITYVNGLIEASIIEDNPNSKDNGIYYYTNRGNGSDKTKYYHEWTYYDEAVLRILKNTFTRNQVYSLVGSNNEKIKALGFDPDTYRTDEVKTQTSLSVSTALNDFIKGLNSENMEKVFEKIKEGYEPNNNNVSFSLVIK